MKKSLPYIFSVILLFSAVMHILKPELYEPMIPDFFPKLAVNIFTAIFEASIGLMLMLKNYRSTGGLFFALLMIGFLPIHIWDLTKETPVIGASPIPEIRVLLQLLLIYAGWWIYKGHKI